MFYYCEELLYETSNRNSKFAFSLEKKYLKATEIKCFGKQLAKIVNDL